ncbi:hypothetical protein CBS147339_1468 [Penicillium roqueforti]|uniref:uncharacterized protein n=1 Tax=Penicillium roqueforti TaxID=5082 RepID=UPI00190C770B|nr:uncharacterized protein LCP9604111_489 [Penicillium roqueforti]KAF9252963.1 hypothetical protein LCP9604111_489 [Penicillium roqueforti]KAI2679362.1 hypothetical protein LCP963914a_7461 [Penicillium roqueforti]KAI2725680.1 hypothetical protein CBS147354_4440 [Penicillium roqueforti]KAI3085218.1 hypothetical protein CBS147339_1468 [Penicillium roqueforti]KAI3108192.1 hypothetical protein CBS147338_54 [Penicillium roqueforti]
MFFIGATVDINLDLQKRKMALNISIHEPFPFLDLPLELRLIIYKFLLSFDEIYIEKRVRDRDVDPHRSGTWMQHNPINNPLAIMSIPEDQPLLGSPFTHSETHSQHGLTIITCTASVLFIASAINNLVALNITQHSSEFGLDPGVELWPMSMHYLAQGCTFLLAGSLADVLGSRRTFLCGCFLQTVCHMASGLARTGMQFITVRFVSGVAYPMCFVSAMSIHRENLPVGKMRNLAFSCTSASQYIGSGVGIVLSGILSETVGWRWGFHCAAILSLFGFLLSFCRIPQQAEEPKYVPWADLAEGIDWSGTLLASSLMVLLFSALAVITNNVQNIGRSGLFIPLALGWILVVAFLFWQDCWERDSTQHIQNSLWTNCHFLSIGLVIFFVYASSLSTSQLMIFVFQRVQGLSVRQSSFQYLAIPIAAALSSLVTGRFLTRVTANQILVIAISLSSFSPLLMATLSTAWPCWKYAMPALSLNPVAPNSVIPIATMLVAGSFPSETQEFAMGVLCTVAMIGASVGMALTALISNDVSTQQLQKPDQSTSLESPEIWMSGYRTAFLFLLSLNLVGLAVTFGCLRKLGFLGRKLDIDH